LELSGFEIEGPNSRLTLEGANTNRIPKTEGIYDGNGIAIWSGHHILLADLKVHDCPGSGLRSNSGDYITITKNLVYNNTWYTASAPSAIVIAAASSMDTRDAIKMRITSNTVYDSYNQIIFYLNPEQEANMGEKFEEPCTPTGTRTYACADADYIIDGQGVYFTRNTDYTHGKWLFANNVTYGNGINGVVVHHTSNAIVTNNIAYMNGATPLSAGR